MKISPNMVKTCVKIAMKLLRKLSVCEFVKYQPSGAGGTLSPPATPHLCNTSPPTLSKMADGVQKYVKPYVIGHSDQLLQNKFFDSIIPSMRTCKIQNGRQGAPKWPTGSGKGSNPRLLAIWSHFAK